MAAKTKIAYSYNAATLAYQGPCIAYADPMNPGQFLLPADATFLAPADGTEAPGNAWYWSGKSWEQRAA